VVVCCGLSRPTPRQLGVVASNTVMHAILMAAEPREELFLEFAVAHTKRASGGNFRHVALGVRDAVSH